MSSQTYLCTRGSFYESRANPTIKSGMFTLFPPLVSPVTPVIMNGANMGKADIVLPDVYLNGNKTLFSFGSAWGRIEITGEILLGSVDFDESGIVNTIANGLRIVETYFSLFRVSKHGGPIILSALRYAKPIKFFLTGYTRGAVNPEFNTISFALNGIVIDNSLKGLEGMALELLDDTLTTGVAAGGAQLSGMLSGSGTAGIISSIL